MTKILFFSSPNGLGHVTRSYAVNQQLQNFSAKFVTANSAIEFLNQMGVEFEEGISSPKLDVQNGFLKKPGKWLWNFSQYHQKCKKHFSGIIERENPDLVVSDEDYASLVIAQEKKIATILITDILETNFTKGLGKIFESQTNRAMKNIIKKCNAVILPFEGRDEANLKHVGPIVRTTNSTREELREKFAFNKKTIVVSIGGTDAGDFLIDKVIQSHTKIKEDTDLVVVSGPVLKKNYINVRNLGFVNNLHEVICAADVVISLAGSSTIAESKVYGTPGIFIPIKNHFEQEDNAREEGFSYEDINQLDSLITQKLEEKRNPQKNEGGKKAAEIILDTLDKRDKNSFN